MKPYICTAAVAPVRAEPAHRSEMTSQLLFGETARLLEQQEEWLRLRFDHDGYEGWVTDHLVQPLPEGHTSFGDPLLAAGLLNPLTGPDGLVNLPMGAALTGYDPGSRLLWDGQHMFHGSYHRPAGLYDESLLLGTVQSWLNAPYLWGGRTILGVDCSGFVQLAFRVQGIALPRDAWQQAEAGLALEPEAAERGDLAFFHNDKGRITHVGILLSPTEIVHASGKVRIDPFGAGGINHKQSGKQTHRLHSVRRVR